VTDPSRPLRVLCIDDNEMVARALGRRIESEPLMKWVGVVHEGALAYDRVREELPDVVLMDIDMPGTDPFLTVERLSKDIPSARVVMFSGHVNSAFIERALDCGAWGYLSKNDDVARLLEGIRRVGDGEIVLSEEVRAVQRAGGRPG